MTLQTDTSPQATTDWVAYNQWNRRDEKMAEVWVRPLIQWLVASGLARRDATVLDFGCGYLDAGLGIAPHVAKVDGFDINPQAADVAAQRARALKDATIFRELARIPAGAYDVVVVNSVIQYLETEAALGQTLKTLRGFLKPNGEVVISDVLPRAYSAPKDAVRSLVVATREGVLPAMVRHLWKAATKPGGLALLMLDPPELARLAGEAGFAAELLDLNLTPSRQRYSVRLRPR